MFYYRWAQFVKTIEAAQVFPTQQNDRAEPAQGRASKGEETQKLKEFRVHTGLRRRPRRLQ